MSIRLGLAAAVAVVIGLASESAFASTIYRLDLESGAVSAKGIITTDSTLGALAVPHILKWHIKLDTGAETFTLNQGNSGLSGTPNALIATASGLFFNFSANDGRFVLFQSNFNYLCFNDTTGSCSSNPQDVAVHTATTGGTFSIGAGSQQVASVVLGAATPLPQSLLLFISALGGLGLVGRHRRKSRTA